MNTLVPQFDATTCQRGLLVSLPLSPPCRRCYSSNQFVAILPMQQDAADPEQGSTADHYVYPGVGRLLDSASGRDSDSYPATDLPEDEFAERRQHLRRNMRQFVISMDDVFTRNPTIVPGSGIHVRSASSDGMAASNTETPENKVFMTGKSGLGSSLGQTTQVEYQCLATNVHDSAMSQRLLLKGNLSGFCVRASDLG
ncbi:unnamed protein product [Protopolystoma xenopodis]|uniref:Uncharacterized protein n=1 Tax=Protopolystoma xenopodis TaxID=117903 RepID=A0A3S5BCT7_9PLAT|nr:unnamed protein product [Protopolystoma xenopodis]